MKLRELSGLSDFRWKELNKTVYWELREQQSHIGPEQKNSALFYDWIDRFLASGIGERFWGKTEGGSLEFPKDRPTIWRILRLVASTILGQMRAFAEGRSKMLAITGLDSAAYARIKAAQDPQYDSRSKEYVRPTKDKLKIADENTAKKIAKTRLNKRPRTNLSYPSHSNGPFEPHINSEKSATDVKASVATLRSYSKFPHLFITHIATTSTTGPRKHHLIDIAEPISLQTFLEKVRVRAEDEMKAGRQITRVHIEIAGRDVNISMDDSEGEWEWGLVMGILMYSGISMGSSTYVRCLTG